MSESTARPDQHSTPKKRMSSSEWFLIGTAISLVGSFFAGGFVMYSKHRETVEKRDKADYDQKEKEAKEQREAEEKRIANAQQAERDRTYTKTMNEMVDLLAAGQNMKAQYEHRLKILSESKDARTSAFDFKKQPVPDPQLLEKSKAIFAKSNPLIIEKLNQKNEALMQEDEARKVAATWDSSFRKELEVIIDATLAAISAAAQQGHIRIEKIVGPTVPADRLFITDFEQKEAGYKDTVTHSSILSVTMEGRGELFLTVGRGRVVSPVFLVSVAGMEKPAAGSLRYEAWVQVRTRSKQMVEKRADGDGHIIFKWADGKLNPPTDSRGRYLLWESDLRTGTENAILSLLLEMRVQAAVDGAKE